MEAAAVVISLIIYGGKGIEATYTTATGLCEVQPTITYWLPFLHSMEARLNINQNFSKN